MRSPALLLLLLLTPKGEGEDAVARGFAAFREGRPEAALAALERAVLERREAAPAELHFDVAIAALACGQPAIAEAAAERALARGGEPYRARRAFVRGSAAFHEGELAAAEAALPDSDPTALDRAIRSVEAARDAWKSAATSRADWPQARRNVERALRKLDELARAKAARERKKAPAPNETPAGSDPAARPPDDVRSNPEASNAPSPAAVPEVDLTPSQVERLLEILQRDEAAKREQRRALRAARPAAHPSERDW
jgi:hypothetical protein